MSSAIESADVATRYLEMLYVVLIYVLTMSLNFTHAQIGLTLGLSGAGPRALECKQNAPSRVHSRPRVRPFALR